MQPWFSLHSKDMKNCNLKTKAVRNYMSRGVRNTSKVHKICAQVQYFNSHIPPVLLPNYTEINR